MHNIRFSKSILAPSIYNLADRLGRVGVKKTLPAPKTFGTEERIKYLKRKASVKKRL
jgi:hypothetical protein